MGYIQAASYMYNWSLQRKGNEIQKIVGEILSQIFQIQ